eukprot:3701010-Amphidinium_carterae.1
MAPSRRALAPVTRVLKHTDCSNLTPQISWLKSSGHKASEAIRLSDSPGNHKGNIHTDSSSLTPLIIQGSGGRENFSGTQVAWSSKVRT